MPRGRSRGRAAAAAVPAAAPAPTPVSPPKSPVKVHEMAFEEGDEVMSKWPGMSIKLLSFLKSPSQKLAVFECK